MFHQMPNFGVKILTFKNIISKSTLKTPVATTFAKKVIWTVY